jgi:toxin ParE1/3/4
MSKWQIIVTPEFQNEIWEIHSYIANTLLVPETANKQINRIFDMVESLDDMPERFPRYDKEPWFSRGLRKVNVDNFIIFYLPVEKTREVVVLHVFYGGRNISELIY